MSATRTSIAALLVLLAAGSTAARDDAGDLIRRGRREAAAGQAEAAESTFARAARIATGDERREAWFLQAGVIRSGTGAEEIYLHILDESAGDEWGVRAAIELAKIDFALGRYDAARDALRQADACRESEEACLFEGLSCVMARHFDEAVVPLESIHRGRLKTWAAFALAEVSEGAGRHEDACARYESLARSRVNPSAWFRYAECLEASGDAEHARREYEALEDAYAQTPEALRAAEKLSAPEASPTVADEAAPPGEGPAGPGYTIQFGSFGDRANATRLYARIKQVYPGVRIDSELINYREVFRVRFGRYASREEAQVAGEPMARELDERFTVMPITARPR